MRTRTTALIITALLLAACGQSARPAASGQLVPLHVGTTSQRITPQGMPTGGFEAANAHLKLKVLDTDGNPVTFKDGAYAPDGDGDTFVTLNSANDYAATLLLPAGSYSFRSAVKDGTDEDASTGVLLAYGDSGTTAVDAQHASVTLGVHSVMNPAAAALSFALPTDTLYTQDHFSLRLTVPTNAVGNNSFAVPTSDYAVGNYSVTGGAIDPSSASELGVGVTTVGSVSDPNVKVSVPVSGWIQNGPETAAYGTQTVSFSHAVQTSTVSADVTAPNEASVTGPSTATTLQSTVVSGLAFDIGGQVSVVRLYDGTALVASSVGTEQTGTINAITFPNADDHWTASWTPSTGGSHTLTVIVDDGAGNESSGTLNVAVSDAQP